MKINSSHFLVPNCWWWVNMFWIFYFFLTLCTVAQTAVKGALRKTDRVHFLFVIQNKSSCPSKKCWKTTFMFWMVKETKSICATEELFWTNYVNTWQVGETFDELQLECQLNVKTHLHLIYFNHILYLWMSTPWHDWLILLYFCVSSQQ